MPAIPLTSLPCQCGHARGRHIGELGVGRCFDCLPNCVEFQLDTVARDEMLAAMMAEAE